VRLALGAGAALWHGFLVIEVVPLFFGFPFTAFLADAQVVFFPLAGVVVIKLATTHCSLLFKLGCGRERAPNPYIASNPHAEKVPAHLF
tara:strand:- start:1456 stop:1722 length:267 start_codon:yes stop_codon:yes gene_type:complete